MWILPKQLHTSAFVQDTKALGLDSEEFSQTCEKSLSWRGKDSLSRTWLQRWKRENWIQHLSSRTLNNSHTESFVDKWTSYLAASRANPSVVQDSVKQLMIPDTCSHTSEMESGTANLELFSLKTWEESSQPRQGTENQFSNMSSENWKAWVTEQRQEYSQRKKSAHLTNASESSSSVWRTPQSQEPGISTERLEGQLDGSRAYDKETGRLAQYGLTQQVQQKWPTARTSDAEGGRIETEMTEQGFKSKRHKSNQTFGAKLRDAVETHEENWATPIANDAKGSDYAGTKKNPKALYLGGQVKNWATPQTFDANNLVRTPEKLAQTRAEKNAGCMNLREQVHYPDMDHSRTAAQNWPTPTTAEGTKIGNQANFGQVGLSNHPSIVGHPDRAKLNKSGKNLESQQWPTPRANKVHPQITQENREHLANRKKSNLEEDIAGHCGKATGKLNPNWVEHLMGLPVGWTQLPIEWIDSDC